MAVTANCSECDTPYQVAKRLFNKATPPRCHKCGGLLLEVIPAPATAPKTPYQERDLILGQLGYHSYSHYLRSDLWKSIRSRVLGRSRKCCGCSRTAKSIHHEWYSFDNLTGKSLDGLHSICRACHKIVEFNNGRKRTLVESVKVLHQIRCGDYSGLDIRSKSLRNALSKRRKNNMRSEVNKALTFK